MLSERALERSERGEGWSADLCLLVRGKKWVGLVLAERSPEGWRSDAISVADGSGC